MKSNSVQFFGGHPVVCWHTTNHIIIPAIHAVKIMNTKTGQAWSSDDMSFPLETLLCFKTAMPSDSAIAINGNVSNKVLPYFSMWSGNAMSNFFGWDLEKVKMFFTCVWLPLASLIYTWGTIQSKFFDQWYMQLTR
jgi:hypothetical protein